MATKKPARLRTKAQTAQAAGDRPKAKVLGGTLEILGDTVVVMDKNGVPVKNVDPREFIPGLGALWCDCVQHADDPAKLAMLPVITRQMDLVTAYSLGYKPSMALLAAPTNVAALEDAVDNAVDQEGPIAAVSGLSYDGIDVEQMKGDRQFLTMLDKLKATADQRVYTTEVIRSHIQVNLAGQVRQIYTSYTGAAANLPEGSTRLADITEMETFMGASAVQAGQDTKKLVTKVKNETTASVMEEMNQQVPGPQMPVGTPGSPPVVPGPGPVPGGHVPAPATGLHNPAPGPGPRTPKPRGKGTGGTKKRG